MMGTVAVVVKCLRPDSSGNKRMTVTFHREADLRFRLRHPPVVTMNDACDVLSPPSTHYLVPH